MRPYEGVVSALEMLRVMCAMGFAASHVPARQADSQVLSHPAFLTRGFPRHRSFVESQEVRTLLFLDAAPGRWCMRSAHSRFSHKNQMAGSPGSPEPYSESSQHCREITPSVFTLILPSFATAESAGPVCFVATARFTSS